MEDDIETEAVRGSRLSVGLRKVSIGAGLALGLIFLVSFFAAPVLSRERAARVSLDALRTGDIPVSEDGPRQDYFTECYFLATLIERSDSSLANAVAIWRPNASSIHECDVLGPIADGTVPRAIPPDEAPYVNYPFGSRYLESFVLAVTDYGTGTGLYRVLSYASVVALFVGAWANNRRLAYLTAPVYLSLLFMFSMHLFGQSLAHAPGFIFGFGMLAFFLDARRLFEDASNRLALFVALGLLMTYFDLLSGALLLTLSLGIVLNHLFYVRSRCAELRPGEYLKTAVGQTLTIVACYAGGYVFLTGLHLGLVSLVHDGVWHSFRDGLALRTGDTDAVGSHVGPLELAVHLWTLRDRLSPFGADAGAWFLIGSSVSWLLALSTIWLAARTAGRQLLCDGAVLLVGAGGVFAWYLLFMNHSYVHAFFTVRFLAVPASYGFVAALLVLEHVPVPSPFRRTASMPELTPSG